MSEKRKFVLEVSYEGTVQEHARMLAGIRSLLVANLKGRERASERGVMATINTGWHARWSVILGGKADNEGVKKVTKRRH